MTGSGTHFIGWLLGIVEAGLLEAFIALNSVFPKGHWDVGIVLVSLVIVVHVVLLFIVWQAEGDS